MEPTMQNQPPVQQPEPQQQPQPQPQQTNMTPAPEEHSAGPAIGLVIILAVIILGGLYFWSTRSSVENEDTVPTPTQTADISAIQAQSDSDDTASIEADLLETNTEDLDSELNAS